MTDHFEELGVIPFSPRLKDHWRRGDLWKRWLDEYPELFDDDDRRLAESQAELGFHFVEWLAAIELWASTGYLSLVAKYEFKSHKRKQDIFRSYAPSAVLDLVDSRGNRGGVQCPDLFLYDPHSTNWLFCEVKGPGDRLRSVQRIYFQQLADIGQRPIGMLRLKETTLL
jgi:hypothetical protein